MRCGTSTRRLGAAAMRSAPAVKIKQAVISTGLRPHCWLARPLQRLPTIQHAMVLETIVSCSKWSSGESPPSPPS